MAGSDLPELPRKAGCLACHGIEHKIVGPAFTWIAYKYKDNRENGRQKIISTIANGSEGQWIRHHGGAMMPPMGKRVTEEQRSELADYILSL
jgi:cytochrome c